MTRKLSEEIEFYRQQVYEGSPICNAYSNLIFFVQKLRTDFSKATTEYKVGGISLGYMDYTYFPFFDEFLREKKLRFGLVLNHHQLRFELWVMAQNAEEKIRQWEKLKNLSWNQEKQAMPKYTVLDVVIEKDPNFEDLELLSDAIIQKSLAEAKKIYPFLE